MIPGFKDQMSSLKWWTRFSRHSIMGILKSVCSSWFAPISRDKYEHTLLRVPIKRHNKAELSDCLWRWQSARMYFPFQLLVYWGQLFKPQASIYQTICRWKEILEDIAVRNVESYCTKCIVQNVEILSLTKW